MPIYEYRCGACGFQKEFLQKLSDPQLKDCPECGKPSLSKMVTAAGFHLKGSGWYATDFKHGTASKAKPAEVDKSAAASADKPAASAEAKPASEAPAKKAEATTAAAATPAASAAGS